MIFSSTWSVCSELQLAGYYLAACGCACKVAQSAVETFRWIFSTQITGIFGNAGNVFGGFQLEIFSISQVVNHITCYKSSAHIGGKSILKKMLYKTCSPVWLSWVQPMRALEWSVKWSVTRLILTNSNWKPPLFDFNLENFKSKKVWGWLRKKWALCELENAQSTYLNTATLTCLGLVNCCLCWLLATKHGVFCMFNLL